MVATEGVQGDLLEAWKEFFGLLKNAPYLTWKDAYTKPYLKKYVGLATGASKPPASGKYDPPEKRKGTTDEQVIKVRRALVSSQSSTDNWQAGEKLEVLFAAKDRLTRASGNKTTQRFHKEHRAVIAGTTNLGTTQQNEQAVEIAKETPSFLQDILGGCFFCLAFSISDVHFKRKFRVQKRRLLIATLHARPQVVLFPSLATRLHLPLLRL